jgi:hypothetical protein
MCWYFNMSDKEVKKISINISSELNDKIRNYADKEKITISAASEKLMTAALELDIESMVSKEKYGLLLEENNNIKKQLEEEKETRLKEYKELLSDYKNLVEKNNETSNQLMELMRADRILQLESKENSESLFHRIKVFFIGDKDNNK